jgi:hypothetical protein
MGQQMKKSHTNKTNINNSKSKLIKILFKLYSKLASNQAINSQTRNQKP